MLKLNYIGSNNGLSPGRRQATVPTNAGILLIWPLWTKFSEILKEILTFSLKNAFQSIVCEAAALLYRPQYVNGVQQVYDRLYAGNQCK